MPTLPVQRLTFVAPEVFELELERQDYAFVPGECAVLFGDDGRSRPYSLSSAPQENVLRFLIRRLPDGALTTWLAQRRAGDRIHISAPFGDFRPGQAGGPGTPSVFVATGVGIAPFLSYLRWQARAPERPHCLYGVRHRRDAVHVDELRATTDLRLAVSREAAPGCHHGRVTDLLPRLPLDPATHFYLCGLDAMVDEAARWLDARGVGHERIHTEVFFSTAEGV